MNTPRKKMQNEFIVFKEGVTEKPVMILSIVGRPYNRSAKIEFYKSLGYTVTTWN